jgi:hypothetical protein
MIYFYVLTVKLIAEFYQSIIYCCAMLCHDEIYLIDWFDYYCAISCFNEMYLIYIVIVYLFISIFIIIIIIIVIIIMCYFCVMFGVCLTAIRNELSYFV